MVSRNSGKTVPLQDLGDAVVSAFSVRDLENKVCKQSRLAESNSTLPVVRCGRLGQVLTI